MDREGWEKAQVFLIAEKGILVLRLCPMYPESSFFWCYTSIISLRLIQPLPQPPEKSHVRMCNCSVHHI